MILSCLSLCTVESHFNFKINYIIYNCYHGNIYKIYYSKISHTNAFKNTHNPKVKSDIHFCKITKELMVNELLLSACD